MLSVLKRKASATISSPGPSASTHPTTTATHAILYPLPYGYVALTPQQMIAKIVEMTNSANPGAVMGHEVLCNFLPNHPHPSPQIVGTKRKADDDDDEEYNLLTEVEADIPHAASVGQKWKGGTNKDLFQTTMMSWTANNMANPFPDDAMVIHISNFLVKNGAMANVEIASEKVNNWLVNCRVRKWRPAIQAAYDMCRPVSMLLEDSTAIFQGKDVRPLPFWDNSLISSSLQPKSATTKTKKPKANKVVPMPPKVPKPRGRPRKNKVVPIMDAVVEDSKSSDLGDLLNMVTFDEDGLADGIGEEFDFLPEGDVEAV